MRLSELSIQRPVLATVMSLLVLVAGAAALLALPVREFPDVEETVVSVMTTYRGASPETVESTLTEPLEQVLNGVDGLRTLRSASGFGASAITLEFHAGRDIDEAATDVANAVQQVVGELPAEATHPVIRKLGAHAFPSTWLSVASERYSPHDLSDIADRIVKPPMQVLPGVGSVELGGERRYAMRIWLDPARMAAHRVDALDVQRAIRESNLQLPAGELEAEARKFTIDANARIDDPAAYEQIVLRKENGRLVRIGDVGWAELGSENYQYITRYSGRPIIGVGVARQSRANELEVARAVRAALPEVRKALPQDVDLFVSLDRALFVEASLAEARFALWQALLAVLAVNLLFLRSLRSTAITAVAIPVSLLGTCAAMWALGFSINLFTLLALVLSIGLLVDDAIVVLENVHRRQELGEPPLRAALRGSREVGFAVLATSASLVAVMIPLSLVPGQTGHLFREFALALAVSIAISLFVALSLVAMLCSRYLKLAPHTGRVSLGIERALLGARTSYGTALDWSLRHRGWVGAALIAIVLVNLVLFARLPRDFLPIEDRGQISIALRAPEGSTAAYTFEALKRIEETLAGIPEVDGFFESIGTSFFGPPSTSSGVVFARLRPWEEREVSQQELVRRLQADFARIPHALVFAANTPSWGMGSDKEVEFVVRGAGASLDELSQVVGEVRGRLAQIPGLLNLDSDLRMENPTLDIRFNREQAADVNVPLSAVAESLRLLVSQGKTDEFILRNRQYDVVMTLASPFRSVPEHLGEIHVRANGGAMVPLAGLIEAVPRSGPSSFNHHQLQRAARISANLGTGAHLGAVLPQIDTILDDVLPEGFNRAFTGFSRDFLESQGQLVATFGIALLVVFLVLSAQFESFLHPLAVMLGVPLALLGALATLALSGMTLNLYSEIGIILLVGLVTKNAILLVDFTNQERARGTELLEAVLRAGQARFRPILMTSFTAILGSVPLMLASGAGAESRQPIGAAVVGGLIFSTLFTLVMIPVVHVLLIRAAERLGWNTIPPRLDLDEGSQDS
jgi:multidrug efflux pump